MAKYESRSTSSPAVYRNSNKAKLTLRLTASGTATSFFNRIRGRLLRSIVMMAALMMLMAIGQTAHAQISPGPLARAHRDLDGPANCTKCHTQSVRSRAFRCAECHREIATELENRRGLHSTYPQAGEPGAACVKCHSDHNGENFSLLHWEPTAKGFDHTKTGYTLDGKHFGVSCRACHTSRNIAPSARGLLTSKDLNHTYFGLTPQCGSCHEDKHQGRFGANCAQCHNTGDWRATRVDAKEFDHSKTRYPLTGLHRTVACERCHTSDAEGKPRYTGIVFGYCAACHKLDPHKGEFKDDCGACHTTATWKKSGFQSTFDHSKTAFPLLGKHIQVNCIDCHKSADFKIPIPHALCADCHKPDPHEGQFAKRADGGKCESCHTVDGWHPSTFTAADHARTGFALVAPHAKVECAQCHKPVGAKTIYKMPYARCVDCHQDEHKGQFAATPWLNKCDQCHTGLTWKTSNFTIATHQKSSFPLTGGHMAVACNECHKPTAGSTVALYHFSKLGCATCHEDIHHGEFADRMADLSPAHQPLGCEACHATKDWHEMSRFDHSTTKFALNGSHRAVACADCHKPPNMERTMLHVNFAEAPVGCNECHQNPHADQFGARAEKCAECHNSNKWKPSLFDHEKTEFSLKGGHQDVACSACHTLKRPVNEELVLFYKPTPKACEACHSNGVPKLTPSTPSGK